MNNNVKCNQVELSVDQVRYYFIWLRVTLLKVISLGIYAPWGNEVLNRFLLENTHCGNKKFSVLPTALNVFKVRTGIAIGLIAMFFLAQAFPALSWLFQLLLLLSLPGFYLLEKKYRLNTVAFEEHSFEFKLSLSQFYKAISFPISIFVFFSAVIFNSEVIDSQFLASIETKKEPSLFAEDSYLAKTEQALEPKSDHELEHEHGHKHQEEIEHWSEDISQEEKDYLGEHEASHNHGSIALSSLQKYQIANQGNLFIQYALVILLCCFLWPWLDYKLITHRVNYTQLAGISWTIHNTLMSLYGLYIKTLLVVFGIIGFMGLIISKFLMGSEGSSPEFWSNALVNGLWLLPMVLLITTLAITLVRTWRKQWLLEGLASEKIETNNHTSYLGGLMLSLTNTIITFVTFGLALPWCQLRTYRYLSHNFNVAIKS